MSGLLRTGNERKADAWFLRLLPAHGSVELGDCFGMLALSQGSCGERSTQMGAMLVSVHQLDCAGAYLGESSGGFGPPCCIDFARVAFVMQVLEQGIGDDDRALIGVEREFVRKCHG